MIRASRMATATHLPIRDRRRAIPIERDTTLTVDGRTIALTNLDRVLYPETGFTKADLVDYALVAAPAILPHLRDRPLTVGRFPGGVDGRGFAQTDIPGRPEWIRTVPLPLANGKTSAFTLVDERATLVWLAQMGVIELHTFLGRLPDIDRPTAILFDLDPTPPAGLVQAAEAALALRALLPEPSYAKTSGSAGIHVLVPTAEGYEAARALSSAVAKELEARRPELVSTRMRRAERAGKVLVDTRQNSPRLTLAAPWSLRATPRPRVSVPVTWDEVAAGSLVFEADEIAERLSTLGDPMSPLAG